VIFDTGGQSLTLGTFLVAMFMSLDVFYGFDTASTLAEETKNPRRDAPKAVVGSVIGAFVIDAIFLYAMLLGIPDLNVAIKESWGPAARPAEDQGAVLASPVGDPGHDRGARLRRRHVREHDVAACGHESPAEGAPRHLQLPLEVAERPAGPVDGAGRDPHRRRDLLPPGPADEDGAPAGAGGRARGG
jgi:hypothetical protein